MYLFFNLLYLVSLYGCHAAFNVYLCELNKRQRIVWHLCPQNTENVYEVIVVWWNKKEVLSLPFSLVIMYVSVLVLLLLLAVFLMYKFLFKREVLFIFPYMNSIISCSEMATSVQLNSVVVSFTMARSQRLIKLRTFQKKSLPVVSLITLHNRSDRRAFGEASDQQMNIRQVYPNIHRHHNFLRAHKNHVWFHWSIQETSPHDEGIKMRTIVLPAPPKYIIAQDKILFRLKLFLISLSAFPRFFC